MAISRRPLLPERCVSVRLSTFSLNAVPISLIRSVTRGLSRSSGDAAPSKENLALDASPKVSSDENSILHPNRGSHFRSDSRWVHTRKPASGQKEMRLRRTAFCLKYGAELPRDCGPSLLPACRSLRPLPRPAGLGDLGQFLRIAHGGAQPLAAFARVELQIRTELLRVMISMVVM